MISHLYDVPHIGALGFLLIIMVPGLAVMLWSDVTDIIKKCRAVSSPGAWKRPLKKMQR